MNTNNHPILYLPPPARRNQQRWSAWFIRTVNTFSPAELCRMYAGVSPKAKLAVCNVFNSLRDNVVGGVAPADREIAVEVARQLARHNPVCPPPGPLTGFRAVLGLEGAGNPAL